MKVLIKKLIKGEKEMEMIFGAVAFVVLFGAWVIAPTMVKKRHAMKIEEEGIE